MGVVSGGGGLPPKRVSSALSKSLSAFVLGMGDGCGTDNENMTEDVDHTNLFWR